MKKYFKPMTKVVKVEENETVLAGSGSGPDSAGYRISGSGSDETGGISKMTSGEVGGGSAFAKPFSPSFDDAE